jgi:hypothetical protein
MGSLYSKLCSDLCSKSSTHEGHTVLNNRDNTLGGEAQGSDHLNPPNPGAAAAAAAERRLKEVNIFPIMKISSFLKDLFLD